jgi:hypothetical protein
LRVATSAITASKVPRYWVRPRPIPSRNNATGRRRHLGTLYPINENMHTNPAAPAAHLIMWRAFTTGITSDFEIRRAPPAE